MWLVLQGEKYNNVQLFKIYTMSKTERSSDAIETLKSLMDDNEKDNNGNRGKHFPLTDIYNEGWMLRLVLSKLDDNENLRECFHCEKETKWFSEAELKSPFLHGKSRETRTHADAVLGSFEFEKDTKTGVYLPERMGDFKSFYAIEAKMYASLSSGVTADKGYNQAARYLGCLAYMVFSSNITDFDKLGLIICAPSDNTTIIRQEEKFEENYFKPLDNRIEAYFAKNKDVDFDKKWPKDRVNEFPNWWKDNKDKFRKRIEILDWEDLVKGDNELIAFYNKCKVYNKK